MSTPPAHTRQGRRTIAQAAVLLNVTRGTVRNLLSAHREEFVPVYGMSRHGRIRLLTQAEIARLGRWLKCWGPSGPRAPGVVKPD